jgi:hypothetical protein
MNLVGPKPQHKAFGAAFVAAFFVAFFLAAFFLVAFFLVAFFLVAFFLTVIRFAIHLTPFYWKIAFSNIHH